MSDESVGKKLEQWEQEQNASRVGTLKLSEAIRIGARLRPQCKRSFFYYGKSCAIGAAIEGIGLKDADLVRVLRTRFAKAWDSGVLNKVYAMNNSGQTREQIADWLEAQGL